MDLYNELRLFQPGPHRLRVITTDLAQPESFMKALAAEEQTHRPDSFTGSQPCVFYSFPYVPPCEPFQELRRLILRIRENTGLQAHFRGVLAIEVSQWLGHTEEEYFTALLAFLYDHPNFDRIALCPGECSPGQLQSLLADCSLFMTPHHIHAGVFEDRQVLQGMLRRELARKERAATREALALLGAALEKKELKSARSLTLLQRVAEDLAALEQSDRSIRLETVRNYLLDPCSTPSLLAHKPLFDERSIEIEQNTLQL